MLTRRAAGAATAAGLLVLAWALPAQAFEGNTGTPPGGTPGPVTPEAGNGTIAVTVTTSGSTGEGRTFSGSVQSTVVPDCWMAPGWTGYEYYEYWKPGGPAREADTLDDYAAQGLLHTDYESHGTDKEGRWYEARCRFDIDAATQTAYLTSHPAVYVEAGDPPPAVDVIVDPQQLLRIAQDNMQLPTGTIRWNPSLDGTGATLVNMDTFVWVEGAPSDVQVTAEVPGVWARVTAGVRSMRLEAPNADDSSCPDVGTPYRDGMKSSSCSIVFNRSSANQTPKQGQDPKLPTVTLTATTVWEASWVSSQNPDPQPLDLQSVTTTAEVPVAEVQTIVTR